MTDNLSLNCAKCSAILTVHSPTEAWQQLTVYHCSDCGARMQLGRGDRGWWLSLIPQAEGS